jgi:hypothetical protein
VKDQHLDFDGKFEKWQRPPRTTPPVIDRRVLPNGEVEEWERVSTIPDDFIYDPETDAYYAPGEPSYDDAEERSKELQQIIRELPTDGPHLISVYMLRAMGALDCPPEWRKSLGVPKKGPLQGSLFADLDDEEE